MGSGRSSRGLGLAHSCGMDKAEVFMDLWRWICPNLPLPIREFRFSKRRFRFDFAFPDRKVAVEIEGGGWLYGRHHRPKGYERDLEKYNLAQSLGWKVFRFTPKCWRMTPMGVWGWSLGPWDGKRQEEERAQGKRSLPLELVEMMDRLEETLRLFLETLERDIRQYQRVLERTVSVLEDPKLWASFSFPFFPSSSPSSSTSSSVSSPSPIPTKFWGSPPSLRTRRLGAPI